MANKRIDQLPINSNALKDTDLIPIWDVINNKTEKVSLNTLSNFIVGVSGDTYVESGIYVSSASTINLYRNDDVIISISGITTSSTFTGNTSGDCISELWVSSISGCSPVTIGPELIVPSITVNDLPLLVQTQVKVSLTTAQLKTAYSIPIDAGIAAPGAGKAIIVTSLAVNLTIGMVEDEESGEMVPDPFNFTKGTLRLQLSGATPNGAGAQYASGAILNNTEFLPNMFVNGNPVLPSTPSIFPNSILHITTDSNATLGTGSAVVYITYFIMDI